MDRYKTLGLAGWLLVIGLSVSVVGFMVFPRTLPGLAAIVQQWSSGRVTSPVASVLRLTQHDGQGDHGAPVIVSSAPLLAFPASPSNSFVERKVPRGQGDPRLYLRDAAAAAHRYDRPGPGRGETRTALWFNAPASIGSTSPPDASPGAPSVLH